MKNRSSDVHHFRSSLLLLAIPCLFVGCGSGSRDQPFLISPQTPSVVVGEKLPLLAQSTVDMLGEPQWEMQELVGGAFLQSTGFRVTFIAPQTAGTYHVVLHYRRPDGAARKFTQEIQVLPQVHLEPAQARVSPGSTVQFSARVKGLPKANLNWYVEEEGGGSISPEGLYTAPRSPGSYRIVASVEGFQGALAYTTVRVE